MESKSLRVDSIHAAMRSLGLNPSKLSERVGVTRQTVSNWLNHDDFPRPDKILKLAVTLGLSFEELVESTFQAPLSEPVIAFRRQARKTTTDTEISRAKGMGELLRPMVDYLPYKRLVRPDEFIEPVIEYSYIQKQVCDLRAELNLPLDKAVDFEHLINKFNDLKATIVPALWGKKESHENALHIFLPKESATWIFLNLDTNIVHFKFWMAHELAHVFTPTLTGKTEGEDFADAFAGAFLFPEPCASKAYKEIHGKQPGIQVNLIKAYADRFVLSPYTIYKELNNYASHYGKDKLERLESSIHGASRNFEKQYRTVSECVFDGHAPNAQDFITKSESAFGTQFFNTLKKYLQEAEEGPSYVQRVMNIPYYDAVSIYGVLLNRDSSTQQGC